MVLVAVGERQPECRHYIPVVHRQVVAQFWLPPVTTFEGTLDNHPAQVGHSFALSERLLEIC
ncbi:hypothetical protein MGG_15692 [Pyricularia oryzae 70-15]|uniref:Uncharacterized protein n=1 Tax=Pyricularia oryzae (strain 70-15 / ATCC MYA-4617 / FGSC 8958) TaxID=242507 RepID=G4MZJ5_PYRO7|nr:uncharacterized protein MGG_15692 [Pyricularia oryzae 70-15]EHA54554.1 hypothetical protein MGG_15692 [Pyricularia oryzae 70-15]